MNFPFGTIKGCVVIVPVSCTAGCLAHDMGLSVHIVCAVNSNDVVARFIRTGQYALADRVHPSLAPAMDVQVGCPPTQYFLVHSQVINAVKHFI